MSKQDHELANRPDEAEAALPRSPFLRAVRGAVGAGADAATSTLGVESSLASGIASALENTVGGPTKRPEHGRCEGDEAPPGAPR